MTHPLLLNRCCMPVVGSSARQAHRLDIFSKSLGQIQNLDPDHLMSALKSRTAPGDTLPSSAILLSDSTQIVGAVARLNALECMRETLALVLEELDDKLKEGQG